MKFFRAALSCVSVAIPGIAFAQGVDTFANIVCLIVSVLNRATGVLVALALVIFLYGAAYNIFKAQERGGAALRQFLVWGVGILFVMVSIWGILRLLQDTFVGQNSNQISVCAGGGDAGSPDPGLTNVSFGTP
jgi:hypothetical protein